MARGNKPVRGGKRKYDRQYEPRRKQKKGKFNFREASYVKERELKNEQIENRRRLLEKEKAQRRERETSDSSEEEQEDSMKVLLATLSDKKELKNFAIESESENEQSDELTDAESSDSDDDSVPNECDNESILTEENDKEIDDDNDNDDMAIDIKEDEEEDKETAEEDAGYLKDPFSIHLNHDLDDDLYKVISCIPQVTEITKLNWPILGNLICEIPKSERNSNNTDKKCKVSVLETKQFARQGKIPILIESIDWNNLYIKSQIQDNITNANSDNIKNNLDTNLVPLTKLQKELFSIINNYQDLYYPERTFSNAEEIRFVYCLHAINHILKTRTKILHHNAKIAKSKSSSSADIPDEYRDQGLVRPKVLIIVPFRHSCLKIVELLISILIGVDKGGSVMNKNRFMEDFSGNELAMPKKNPKPEDYELTFQGNTDDTFKIGISITKKTLKLYSEFYSSDIIISSLLGLRMLIGAEGEAEREYDFLASIELLIMDQSELFFMQNWDHMIHILNHLHLQPKESHGIDFSRVRSWCINGWTKYYRQTLIFSGIQLPEIHSIFNKRCFNYAGKVKVINPIYPGSICQIITQVPQIFHKFNATSHTLSLENRMEFFINKILPQYKDSVMNHTLIFVSSYFDFVKLRNYLKKEDFSFVQICEYSKEAKIARARDMFFHSDAHFLLYSERFHFFRRIRVKGIRHIIFYALPTIPHFYSEICNLMQEANQNPKAGLESNMTVTSIYCKYDVFALAGIVGTEKASKMIASEKSVHMLITSE
ncbi:U3 small nucleolar RNA-associated protein 25 homolog [Vespa crabro]|uniref:U3 small nucleolar RNA-associated protein 25 homolog n=1 Tax=Vespa crabro TaxID=7445 RepID=UPI001F008B14|nr:U3 small nucleolar RNA-associated protein 25 homolog [Vespa crabro]